MLGWVSLVVKGGGLWRGGGLGAGQFANLHCYFDIKYHKNNDGSIMACPSCRQSIWYSMSNDYLRKMVKTMIS